MPLTIAADPGTLNAEQRTITVPARDEIGGPVTCAVSWEVVERLTQFRGLHPEDLLAAFEVYRRTIEARWQRAYALHGTDPQGRVLLSSSSGL